MCKIIIINGPNINLIGKREPEIYGNINFVAYFNTLKDKYPNVYLEHFQSNHEGDIIDKIQNVGFDYNGIILNAAAYSHTSIAIADAILAINTVVVEVHISNIFTREKYRQKSMISAYCKGIISGFGLNSYELALIDLISNCETKI